MFNVIIIQMFNVIIQINQIFNLLILFIIQMLH